MHHTPIDFADYFLCNPRITTAATKDQYRFALADFSAMLGRKPMISDLSDQNLNKFTTWMIRERRLSPCTANERTGRLVAYWRFLCSTGVLIRQPLVTRAHEPRRAPVAWTIEELRQLVASLEKLPGRVSGIPARDWWRAVVLCCWSSGERISAMIALKWSDVKGRTIFIPAEARKQKTADAVYHLDDQAVAALDAIREPTREKVFPWELSKCYLWIRFGRIVKRSGLATGRERSFHCIRRSVASHYTALGGDATAALGHSDRRVTAAYLDPRIVVAPQVSDVLPKIG